MYGWSSYKQTPKLEIMWVVAKAIHCHKMTISLMLGWSCDEQTPKQAITWLVVESYTST